MQPAISDRRAATKEPSPRESEEGQSHRGPLWWGFLILRTEKQGRHKVVSGLCVTSEKYKSGTGSTRSIVRGCISLPPNTPDQLALEAQIHFLTFLEAGSPRPMCSPRSSWSFSWLVCAPFPLCPSVPSPLCTYSLRLLFSLMKTPGLIGHPLRPH